jgi:DNA-binding NtrC family response regulator
MSELEPQYPEPTNPTDSGSNASTYAPEGFDLTLSSSVTKAEIQAISRALEQTRWNRKQAARLLKISYRSLLYKIRDHRLTQPFETCTRQPDNQG